MKNTRTTSLVGKAALHLACFHLARLGHDFTITRENSKTGDLWVDFGSGIEVVEVKGMTAGAWQLRADQIARVSRFIFVAVDEGCCWMVPVAPVADRLKGKTTTAITIRQVEGLNGECLHKRVGRVVPFWPTEKPKYDPNGKGNRIVRKRLADGTVKEYRYGPHSAKLQPFYNGPRDTGTS